MELEKSQNLINAEKLASEIIEKSKLIQNDIKVNGLASNVSLAKISNSEIDFEYYLDLLGMDSSQYDPLVFEQGIEDAIELANSVVGTDLETALQSYNLSEFTIESLTEMIDGVTIEDLEIVPEYISIDDDLIQDTLLTMNVLTEKDISNSTDLFAKNNGSKGNGFHGLLGFLVGALIFNSLIGAVIVAVVFVVADNVIEGNF